MSNKQEQKEFELKSINNLLGVHGNELSFLEKLQTSE
jgi:hypothetical protein